MGFLTLYSHTETSKLTTLEPIILDMGVYNFFSFWHSLLDKPVFLGCTLTAYHVAAMLSKPVPSK